MDRSNDSFLTERRLPNAAIAVAAITAGAVIARLVGLGHRVFHWDEGRVGYWTLRYMESGVFEYRPIIHGPFLPLVNSRIFTLLG
ncbi:TIGR03663 family protein, partial [Clostridioides difficile]|nr:TIGR03663 family protein [Clostridioides difficile]